MSDQRFIVPEIMSSHLHLRPGDRVGDFGAGTGYFISTLSRLVGPQGRVYACEIQKNLVDALAEKIRKEHLSNVEVIWGDFEDLEGSKIENDNLDVAIIVNTLFQVENKSVVIQEIARTLRSGGKLFIVDWSESWGGIGPQVGDVFSANDARALAEGSGFTFEREFDAGDHHYGLAFRKA